MKSIVYYSLTLVALSALLACEKVIDVELDSADRRYVIEGSVTDQAGPYQVSITQTKDFDQDNTFAGVTDAEVTLTDDVGNSETLERVEVGVYQTTNLRGVPGRTYTLTVVVADQQFIASSTLPEVVPFDNLFIEELEFFGQEIKVTNVEFNDPAGVANFYRYLLFINNRQVQSLYYNDDELQDGNAVERRLLYFGNDEDDDEDDELEEGDIVEVEMQSIDRGVYDYFFSLDQTIEQSAAAPANPVSNVKGGALGYFSAHTVQTKAIVVP